MWVFLFVTCAILTYAAQWAEVWNGTVGSRNSRIGYFQSGNFLHGTWFDKSGIVWNLSNLIAPLWRNGVYEEWPSNVDPDHIIDPWDK